MRVYLASWYASRSLMKERASELAAMGIEVTSRWLQESNNPASTIKETDDNYLRDTARVDLEDVLLADTVVLNIPSDKDFDDYKLPIGTWARGGRHFEAGFQYATMMFFTYLPIHISKRGYRNLILVGDRENVFHYLDGFVDTSQADSMFLPTIKQFPDWESAKEYLSGRK